MGSTFVTNGQKIIAVCGVKNSGKTTLIEKLVRRLTQEGVRVAVIKHDGHDFSCDVPGTDSFRFQEAGAYGTAVFSEYRTFIHKEGCHEREQELIRRFPEAEIIFLEGLKNSSYPKMEVVRKGISDAPVSNPEGRFLIVTDWEKDRFAEETAGLEEIEAIIKKLKNMKTENKKNEK